MGIALQHAAALWWLLPLLTGLIVLYLLKMRRRDLRVPASFLWTPQTADVRANAPFQRLRWSWLLLLQLLVFLLLILGLANPLRRTRGLHGRATVLVIDASASMGATDASPTRFEAARKGVTGIIQTMETDDRLALIEAGATTRVVFPLTGDKARMEAAVRTLRPSDAASEMGEALRLASALVGQRDGGRIVVLSDGAFPPVTDFSPGKAQLLFEPVGTSRRNLAITAFDSAETPKGIELFASVHNYDSAPITTTLTFEADGAAVDARKITVPARQSIGQTVQVSATARRAVASITDNDILAADNRATLYLQGAGTVRTLLISPGNFFLERALALEPTIRLERAPVVPDSERAEAEGKGHYDLIIFDGVPPIPVKAPAVWSFGGISSDFAVEDLGTLQNPRIVNARPDSPLLRHTDLNSLMIQKAHRVRLKAEGRTVVEGADSPLMVAGERGGRRSLYVAWNLLDSDFPLQVSFPIFVGNAIAYLSGGDKASGTNTGLNVRAGQPFVIALPESARSLSVTRPTHETVTVPGTNGIAIVRETDRVGDYTIETGKQHTDVAVNLLNETESDVTPHITLDVSGKTVAAQSSAQVLSENWRPLLLLALLILTAEWWLFVRRS